VQPNLYLQDVPPLLARPQTPPASAAAVNLMDSAERHFQQGRRLYQAQDYKRARREFDAAVDNMLEASSHPIPDRRAFEDKFDRMVESVHRYDLAGLGAAADPEDPARFEKAPLEDILEMTFPVDPRLKSKAKEQVRATASQLPLSINDGVLGYIHYFMGRGRRTLVSGLERAGRYEQMIRRILDEEGVPQELIHLAQAESGFLPRAISRKAATGMWQFMAFRGRQYGLMQTPSTDDRLDPEKATRAAARHLRDLYTEFGDWYLAIAAYNCGPAVVEKAVERTGYADFWELRNLRVLPAETTNYVPIILAMTIMHKNAAEYGLSHITPEAPLEYDTVEVSTATHLPLVADLLEAPVSELMALNPALLKTVAPEGYGMRVPKGSGSALMAALEMIPRERRASWRVHKVEEGESLADIGKRWSISGASIASVNHLAADGPMAGDRLVIPAAPVKAKSTRAAPSRNARQPKRRGAAVASVNPAKPAAASGAKKAAPAKGDNAARSVKRGPATASNRPHVPAGNN
jgi:membrane-bound lytic murein transglycosylase D